jgi:hypothetical protein
MAKKKSPNAKPTNREIVAVVTQLINQVEFQKHQIMSLTNVLDLLVEFDGKAEEFKAFAQAKMIERRQENAEDTQAKGVIAYDNQPNEHVNGQDTDGDKENKTVRPEGVRA